MQRPAPGPGSAAAAAAPQLARPSGLVPLPGRVILNGARGTKAPGAADGASTSDGGASAGAPQAPPPPPGVPFAIVGLTKAQLDAPLKVPGVVELSPALGGQAVFRGPGGAEKRCEATLAAYGVERCVFAARGSMSVVLRGYFGHRMGTPPLFLISGPPYLINAFNPMQSAPLVSPSVMNSTVRLQAVAGSHSFVAFSINHAFSFRGLGFCIDRAFSPRRLELIRGLHNPEGQYNCFLNVILQGLWALTSFRRALLALAPPALAQRGGTPTDVRVLQALHGIFAAMATRPTPAQLQVLHLLTFPLLRSVSEAGDCILFSCLCCIASAFFIPKAECANRVPCSVHTAPGTCLGSPMVPSRCTTYCLVAQASVVIVVTLSRHISNRDEPCYRCPCRRLPPPGLYRLVTCGLL